MTTEGGGATQVRALFESKARAELLAADGLAPGSDSVRWRGSLLAEVAVVKGLPGPAEASGGEALSGADGEAASKALSALGWDPSALFFTLSRPEPGTPAEQRRERLRMQVEAVDPALVLAVDAAALEDVADAFGIRAPSFGKAVWILGRRFAAVDGLEASLVEPARKRRVWKQMQCAQPEGPAY